MNESKRNRKDLLNQQQKTNYNINETVIRMWIAKESVIKAMNPNREACVVIMLDIQNCNLNYTNGVIIQCELEFQVSVIRL